MCGIIGYIGKKEIADVLIEGLKCLEYRGYDSSGIAINNKNGLSVIKAVGKITKLEELINKTPIHKNGKVSSGIGHTRWATHGIPSEANAHPHFNTDESIAVVHNGIIRNYIEVKESLKSKGINFSSETDTEVIVHLLGENLKDTKSILKAICKTVETLDGSYALGIVFKDEPYKIYAVRKESPLIIGVGKHENYIASDTPTVSKFVNKIIKLLDNEIAEITEDDVKIYNTKGKKVKKKKEKVKFSKDIMDKKGFKHYLEKEINEQPEVVSNLLTEYMSANNKIKFDHLNIPINNIEKILILACGTAYHAGLVGKHIIETLARIPVEVQFASEFLSSTSLLNEKSLVIGISQSGETADTLASIKKALESKAQFLAITNRPDSAIADLANKNLIISRSGVEISVAATKTFIAQLLILYLLAVYIAEKKLGNSNNLENIKNDLRKLPQLIDQTITRSEYYQEQILKYSSKKDFVFIGRGINYPIALEAALKLKELSYIHASGYASGEMKHGPIAVLDKNVPVVSIIMPGESYEKVLQNSLEAKSRHAPLIAVGVDGDKNLENIFNTVLHIPAIDEILSPFLSVIPMQFLSYYIAEALGQDVDQPRNLAKSVTVE